MSKFLDARIQVVVHVDFYKVIRCTIPSLFVHKLGNFGVPQDIIQLVGETTMYVEHRGVKSYKYPNTSGVPQDPLLF